MKILVDGVFFQLAQSGIARLWRSVLPELVRMPDVGVAVLDRGGVPEMAGVVRIPFPSYTLARYNADDSTLIEAACRHWESDLFMSTYYTTPMTTPSIAVVYDMIPELLGFDLSVRDWMEKELALSYARHHICISHQTRADLLRFYPELNPARVSVAHCGVDPAIFAAKPVSDAATSWHRFGFQRPYFILVGSRNQHQNYKNARLFFEAAAALDDIDFDILCVGGEQEIDDSARTALEGRCRLLRVNLTDEELAEAYRHAIALVYPSLYEGFGMPVIEAMACGCPVVTTNLGSLKESAGDAALLVDGYSINEMVAAIQMVRSPEVRLSLIARGKAHSARFRWSSFAETLYRASHDVVSERRSGSLEEFNLIWSDLRQMQRQLDVA